MKTEPLTDQEIQRLAELGFDIPLNQPGAEDRARVVLDMDAQTQQEIVPPLPTKWTLTDCLIAGVLLIGIAPVAILFSIVLAVVFFFSAFYHLGVAISRRLPLTRHRDSPPSSQ
jgi:hypothetical protein